MSKKFQTSADWGLTRLEFNTALWGNPIGDFKITNEYMKSYNVTDDITLDRVFNQLTTEAVQRITGKAYVLEQTGGIKVFPIELQEQMRFLAYYITALGLKNGLFEKTSNQNVSGANLNIENDLSGWTLPADNIPSTAWERLEKTGIFDYKVIDGTLYLNDDALKSFFKNNFYLEQIDFQPLAGEDSNFYALPSVKFMQDAIAAAIKAEKEILGKVTDDTSADFPTNAEINALYNGAGIVLDSGEIVKADGTGDLVAEELDQIEYLVTTAGTSFPLPEMLEFLNGQWRYITQRNQVAEEITAIQNKLATKSDKDKVIDIEGLNEFVSTYAPTNDFQAATLKWVKDYIAANPDALAATLAAKKVAAANGDISNPRDLSDLPVDFQGFTDQQIRESTIATLQDIFRELDPLKNDKLDTSGHPASKILKTDVNGLIVFEDVDYLTATEVENIYAKKVEVYLRTEANLQFASKAQFDALVEDFENLSQAVATKELWKPTPPSTGFPLPLVATDNTIPWSSEIATAIGGVPVGSRLILKLQDPAGDPVSVFLDESANDNSFTSNNFLGDEVEVKVDATNLVINDLANKLQGTYLLLEIRTAVSNAVINPASKANVSLDNVNLGAANAGRLLRIKADGGIEVIQDTKAEQADVDGKALKDLSDVNVGAANAGKLIRVAADGKLEYFDFIKYYKGQILEFDEVKTGTKFEDTTLFTKTLTTQSALLKLGATDYSPFSAGVNFKNRSGKLVGPEGSFAMTGGILAYDDTAVGGNKAAVMPANLYADLSKAGAGIVRYTAKKDIKESEML